MNQQNNSTNRLVVGLVVGVIFGLGLGLIAGLVFAYQISPVQWTNAGPQDLRVDYAAYYWELVAESYNKNGDLETAQRQLGDWNAETLQETLARADQESSPELKMALETLSNKLFPGGQPSETPVAQQTPTGDTEGEGEGSPLGSLLPRLAVVGLIALVLIVVALFVTRMRKRRDAAPAQEAVEESPEWLSTLQSEQGDISLPALGHFVTSYALGNDTYDESFSAETSAGEFLGECGVGISETIGVGDPDKVTAFEVWLFDKNDIRTVTQVLMSEHAFNDPDLRADLAPKGEAMLAQVNQPMSLETATLRLDVLITEMTYGSGALPPNSFFERLTIELVSRRKEEGTSEESGIL